MRRQDVAQRPDMLYLDAAASAHDLHAGRDTALGPGDELVGINRRRHLVVAVGGNIILALGLGIDADRALPLSYSGFGFRSDRWLRGCGGMQPP